MCAMRSWPSVAMWRAAAAAPSLSCVLIMLRGASSSTDAMRTYGQPASARMSASAWSSDTDGGKIAPNSFCCSTNDRMLAWKSRIAAVARPHDQLEARALERVQDAALHVDDVLRARVVVDQRDQERAAKRERARLRIGRKAVLGDDQLHLLARLLAHERRIVDDARHGLLRNVRKPRDIVDRDLGLVARRDRRLGTVGRRFVLSFGTSGSD